MKTIILESAQKEYMYALKESEKHWWFNKRYASYDCDTILIRVCRCEWLLETRMFGCEVDVNSPMLQEIYCGFDLRNW